MRFMYGSKLGRFFLDTLLTKPWLSQAYGSLQSSTLSCGKISKFISDYKINMQEFENRDFTDFNDFFTRKFIAAARRFDSDSSKLSAFCEGRYLAFDSLSESGTLPVKGFFLKPRDLLGNSKWADSFIGGPGFIARLCPVDYHRYHFPDSGRKIERFSIHGPLHSVNPIALNARPKALFTNERQVTILDTDHFGKLAYIEVGALMVGKIVESHQSETFARGDEKGFFLFGGSTVILLAQPGRLKVDSDLLEKSAEGIETLVELGRPIGFRT